MADLIQGIISKVKQGRYEYTRHAVDQGIVRGVSVAEVREALILDPELIEDYPDDHYGPSCLVLGFTERKRPIHVVCSYPSREFVKIITVYVPDEHEWVDVRIRRKEQAP